MRAKFPGTCVKCGAHISVGQDISWTRKPRLDGLRTAAWHVSCSYMADKAETVNMLLEKQNKRFQPVDSTLTTPTIQMESTTMGNTDFMAGMAEALLPYFDGKINTNLDSVKAEVKATLEGIEPKLQDMIDRASRTIVVENRVKDVITDVGKQHENFAKLLSLVSGGMDVYLHGEPGTGKTTAGAKVAEALSLTFGYISLTVQTSESRLIGYKDANGNYVETEFYKRYTEGGIFLIDEIDNASGNLLTALNSALANGKGAFPCGNVERHPDFICIATGNTTGFGHNPMFPERQVLSGAIRDRFVFLNWSYDEQFEKELALAQHDNKTRTGKWVAWVQKVRAYARQFDAKLPVTPRASIKGARLLEDFSPAEVAEMLVFRGYDKDSVTRILTNNPLPVLV